MSEHKIKILDQTSIRARLKRMAYEIYERNFHSPDLIVIGIDERGGFLGGEIVAYLHEISPLSVEYVVANIDKESDPVSYGVDLSIDIETLKGKRVVVVDDVLYTGRTLLNVVAILLQAAPETIQTAILIDRGHRSLPVSSDIVGFELATTIQQHVSVEIDQDLNRVNAFLM